MAASAGDVVLLPFPYRDRQGQKTRPAVVISSRAYNQHGDVIVAGITSHPPRTATDYSLTDWRFAGLVSPSTVRMLLMTAAQTRILRVIGSLNAPDWAAVQARVLQVFAWP